MEKQLDDFYKQEVFEVTLEKKVKLPIKKLKHLIKPKYGLKKFKVKIGKVTIMDQLAAQKENFDNLGPEKIDANLYFLAWLLDRLIKKIDPYWDLSLTKLIEMFCEDTFIELTEIWTQSIAKKNKTMNPEKANQQNGKK